MKFFGLFFDQKWNFFAPPPQENDRLYFTYFDENKKPIAFFEILTPIVKAKKDTRPFNTRAEMIDYTIYGAIADISSNVIALREKEKLKHNNYDLIKLDSIAKQKVIDNSEKVKGFLLLKNYSQIVAKKFLNEVQFQKAKYVGIKINTVKIKKFSDRYKKIPDTEYNLIEFKPYHIQ